MLDSGIAKLKKGALSFLKGVPIIGDLTDARLPEWKEALTEILVILIFSLMPLWVGLIMTGIVTFTEGPEHFLKNFASTSDLGILAASLLGPLIYMLFKDDSQSSSDGGGPRFPSGLWFTLIIIVCCIIATVIYCEVYLSGLNNFYNKEGSLFRFIDPDSVAKISWILFVVSILLVLFASTIRNTIYTRPSRMMSNDTQEYVQALQSAEEASAAPNLDVDAQTFTAAMQAPTSTHEEEQDDGR